MIPHFPFTARLWEIGRVSTKAKRLKTNKKREILNDRLILNDPGSQLSRLIIHRIFPREIYGLIASSVSRRRQEKLQLWNRKWKILF